MSSDVTNGVMQQIGLTSYEMSTSINRAQRAFRELLKICLSHNNLTIPQWTLLGTLYKNKPQRPIAISRSLGIKPPYIAKLISELEFQGFIASIEFEDDARGKAILLTDEGKHLVEAVEIKLARCLDEQLNDVKQTDLKTFFTLTEYIAQNVHHKN